MDFSGFAVNSIFARSDPSRGALTSEFCSRLTNGVNENIFTRLSRVIARLVLFCLSSYEIIHVYAPSADSSWISASLQFRLRQRLVKTDFPLELKVRISLRILFIFYQLPYMLPEILAHFTLSEKTEYIHFF